MLSNHPEVERSSVERVERVTRGGPLPISGRRLRGENAQSEAKVYYEEPRTAGTLFR